MKTIDEVVESALFRYKMPGIPNIRKPDLMLLGKNELEELLDSVCRQYVWENEKQADIIIKLKEDNLLLESRNKMFEDRLERIEEEL